MTNIRYQKCDADLKRLVGEVMGDIAKRHIRLKEGFAFVAMDVQTPVGVIAVYRRRLPDPLPETFEGFINIIEVAKSHRRRGIGRRLVEMSIVRCQDEGLYQIRGWSSDDKSEAIPMWKRNRAPEPRYRGRIFPLTHTMYCVILCVIGDRNSGDKFIH
jgi:ribosomal protein S18 acetylase RimI-like enzyme